MRRIIFLILFLNFCFGLARQGLSQGEDIENQKQLKQEIHILNLINGLYLSDGQMRFLIMQAKKAEALQNSYLEKYQQHTKNSDKPLKKLKEELLEDKGEVSKAIAREVHLTNKKMLELKAGYEKEVDEIIEDVKNNLTQSQLYLMENFKLCLIPPKGPMRIGQADDHTAGIKQLEQIRKLSNSKYPLLRDEHAEKILEHATLHKPRWVKIDECEAKDKIFSIFDEARSLSDIDFELKKKELAEELKESILPTQKTVNVDNKIEHFLLDPVTISILGEKIKNS